MNFAKAIALVVFMTFASTSVMTSTAEAKRTQSSYKKKKSKKQLYQYRCNVYNKKKRYRKYRKWKRYCDRLEVMNKVLKNIETKKQYRGFFSNFFNQSNIYKDDGSASSFFAADRAMMQAHKQDIGSVNTSTEPLKKKQIKTRVVLFEQNNDDDPSPFRSFFEKKHVAIARKYEGMTARRNRRTLRTVMNIDPMRIPWCAAFANAVLKKAGYEGTGSLMARSFLSYGKKTWRPSKGDIVVFKRGRSRSSGHVGFYMGETVHAGVRYILVLGGNQRKAVNIAMYPKRKVLGYRKITV